MEQVFLYPTEPGDRAEWAARCAQVGLPAPRCWHATHLPLTLRALVEQAADDVPADPAASGRAAGLPAPLVLLVGVAEPRVRALVVAAKQAGRWPIFAVLTPRSAAMTLAVLCEHLAADRAREVQLRRRRATPTPPAGAAP